VANEFGVLTRRFQGKTALAYTLEHSSFLYVLDPQGRVRVMYPATVDLQDIARDLRQLWRAPAG
jgi:cytochrome oxidase Cu insertion factor (SCO1/SenC/PrrC family)